MLFSPISIWTYINISNIFIAIIPFSKGFYKIINFLDINRICPFWNYFCNIIAFFILYIIFSSCIEYPFWRYIFFIGSYICIHNSKSYFLFSFLAIFNYIINLWPFKLSLFWLNINPIISIIYNTKDINLSLLLCVIFLTKTKRKPVFMQVLSNFYFS